VRARAAVLLALLSVSAGAGDADPAGRVWAVRVTRSQPGAAEHDEVFLAAALPAGPEGVLVAAGFFLDLPREPELIEVVAIAPDGTERAASLLGGVERPECTFFRLPAGERPAPVALQGARPNVGDGLVVVARHGTAFRHAARRLRTRVEAEAREPERLYAAEGLTGEWLGAVAFTSEGALVGFVAERPTMDEDGAFVVGLTDTMAVIVPADAYADAARSPGPPDVKAWLGINLAPFDENREAYFGIEADWPGAFVTGVAEGSPAAKAGVRLGDVVQRIGDLDLVLEKVDETPALIRRVQRLPTGKPLPCTIVRFSEGAGGGFTPERLAIDVTLEPRPLDFADAPEADLPDLGLKTKPATVDWLTGRALALDTKGVVVTKVKSGSPAELAGLQPDDLLLKVDDAPSPDADSVRAALAAAKSAGRPKVVLFVRRGAETSFVSVRTN